MVHGPWTMVYGLWSMVAFGRTCVDEHVHESQFTVASARPIACQGPHDIAFVSHIAFSSIALISLLFDRSITSEIVLSVFDE